MRFSDIPGHEKLKADLRNLVDSGQVPHAIMISGPAGAGKMRLARAYAQYLHCENRHDGEPCGHCRSCRLHAELNHPDLHFSFPVLKVEKIPPISASYMEPWKKMLTTYPSMPEERWVDVLEAGNKQPTFYVEEASEIIRSDALHSFMSDRKIFIIWLPEKMSRDVANKLLKVIEEPEEGTTFVFVCNNELGILPTIYSRVQRFHAGRLSTAEIERYLIDTMQFSEQAAMKYAPLCEGSLIKADELGETDGESDEFLSIYQDVMRSAYARKPARLRQIADKVAAFGRSKIRRFLLYMAHQLRENFIYNMKVPQLNALSPEEEDFSRKFSPFVNHLNIEDFMRETDRARVDVENNGNSRLVLFDYFILIIILLRRKPTQ